MQTWLETVHRLDAALGLTRRLLTSGRPEELDRVQAVLIEAHAALEVLAASPNLQEGRDAFAQELARLEATVRRQERVNAAGLTAARDLLAAGGHGALYDVRARATAAGPGVTLHTRG